MTTYTWRGDAVTANWTDTSEWSVSGAPVDRFPIPGDVAWIGAGTVELDITQVADISVSLFQQAQNVTADNVVLVAANIDLGDRSQLLTATIPGNVGSIVFDVVGSATLDDENAAADPAPQPGSIDFSAAPLTIELSAGSGPDATATFINNGAISGGALVMIAGAGVTSASFVNNTTIDATGPLQLAAGVTLNGSGFIDLDGFEASASIDGAVGAGQTVRFVNGGSGNVLGGTLVIADLAQFHGTVDLDREHQIVLPGVTAAVQGTTDGVLTFVDGSTLNVVAVGNANTVSTYELPAPGETVVFAASVACFCTGTRIATPAGDVPVEDVDIGMSVRRAGGGAAAVVWVGRRDVSCDRHPRPHDVWPVRIRVDALAPGRPARDLLLSPDHAVLVAGHLIPVRHLVNGATIVQQPTPAVRYHHIELAQHDLLLAEGVAAESFLDTGNRASFVGGGPALALHPAFSRQVWAAAGCAALVQSGPALVAARRALLRRAARLGYRSTRDPALRMLADGHVVRPASGADGWSLPLPADTREARLLSRAWVPAQMHPDDDDVRCLGVGIGQIWLDGREVGLDSPALTTGWYATEPEMRWTDGDATLAVAGARTLTFKVAMVGEYWRDTPSRTVAARRA